MSACAGLLKRLEDVACVSGGMKVVDGKTRQSR